MEIIFNNLHHNLNINKYFNNLNSCFIDIETTGLDRNKQIIYLIGLLFYDDSNNTWTLKQYFANNKSSEKTLLQNFMMDISSFDNLISYNGDNFDIPFINHRLKTHGLDEFIPKSKSYDLYKVIKSNKDYLNLENLKLKTVERSLGYYREDKYSGFECIRFYYEYIKNKDNLLKEKILKHNSDDLFYMLDIIQILDVIKERKTIYLTSNKSMVNFIIDTLDIKENILYVSGSISTPLKNNIKFFSNSYNIYTEDLKNFKIKIDIRYGYVSKDEKCAYIDSLDYPNFKLYSSSKYNIPPNIFILKVEKELYLDNIKLLLKNIIEDII